ncbi:histidine kinase [Caulobacter henricii]|uniref:histidine kinase n=2 Tax=Caulobacter henricii TaxID=69395 RepID=A0A0N7JHZ7_9CAUL|nr:histidine kinase [Caulobacter henricii]
MGVSESQRNLARAAASRMANIYLRLFATATITVVLYLAAGMDWIWIWAGVYLLALLGEQWATRSVAAHPEATPSPWRRWALTVSPFLTSATFGFLALPLFASDLRFAPTLGAMLIAGSLLNVIVVNGSLRSATLSAALPHLVYLLAAPLIARTANPDAPLANVLWVGAALLIISVAVASRTLSAALQAEADAKHEAELRRQEAEEAVAAKSAFVAMISHELRTPISAILAGAARLHSEVPEASSKIHAQLISDAGGLMRALLNDLLDFSRLEVGRMAVEKAPFNLRQTLSDTLRLWRPEAAKKGLRLRVVGAASLPKWVSGDALRLRQVLNNLLSNAIKFTDRGAVEVRLGSRDEGSGHHLTITVVDTGSGISQADMARLFTPFEQLSTSVVRQHGGSGLGLVISRELARLMGGDLVVSSVEGQGATFTLSLQVEAAEAPQVGEVGPSVAGTRVLVVDDHVVNRRAIELVLQPFGVDATLAESGEQALELLSAEVFDVVLMDVYMPGMDGREATRVLRSGSGPNRDTPVIAVTASATPKDWDACRAAGMNAHVAKPIDPIELYAALAQVLSPDQRDAANRTPAAATP